MLKWYEQTGPEGDIVISTRVRLARNLSGRPFVAHMSDSQREQVLGECLAAAKVSKDDLRYTDVEKLSPVERRALTERHAVSPEFEQMSGRRGLLLSPDERISVMINEEDHLRIQYMEAGLNIEKCLEGAQRLDDLFDAGLSYAFSPDLGYLTACPTNLGTGMRISVMLHLDALTRNRRMESLTRALADVGLTVRGVYGEGSGAEGGVYQISNQLTLGPTEQELANKLKNAVLQIIERERAMRSAEYKAAPDQVEDGVWRALGTARSARIMSSAEAMKLISRLRLGVGLGILKKPDIAGLNALSSSIGPACVMLAGAAGDSASRDKFRAGLMRKALGGEM